MPGYHNILLPGDTNVTNSWKMKFIIKTEITYNLKSLIKVQVKQYWTKGHCNHFVSTHFTNKQLLATVFSSERNSENKKKCHTSAVKISTIQNQKNVELFPEQFSSCCPRASPGCLNRLCWADIASLKQQMHPRRSVSSLPWCYPVCTRFHTLSGHHDLISLPLRSPRQTWYFPVLSKMIQSAARKLPVPKILTNCTENTGINENLLNHDQHISCPYK